MAFYFQQFRTAGFDPVYAHLRRRSTWPARMAVLTGVLVAVLPLLVVVVAALLAAAAVYAVCAVLVKLGSLLGVGDAGPGGDASVDHGPAEVRRENVRVIGGGVD